MINSIGKYAGRIVALVCLLFWGSLTASAHDPGLSAAEIQIGGAHIVIHWSIARSDLESVLALDPGQSSGNDLSGATPWLEHFARNAFEINISDRRAAPMSVDVRPEQAGAIAIQITFERVEGSLIGIRSTAIRSFARGHREYVSVVDERGNRLGAKMLDVADAEFDLVLRPGSTAHGRPVLQFLVLGIEHILTGYDHLVFLIGLLLAKAGFRDAARIITSFTAAHSISLALSTFNLVRMSPAVVEPLIALSIIYVGLENILRSDLAGRWLLTFGFGLIHGFGFASALRELGIGSGASAALPLVTFNAGVEIGQLVIALIVLPMIWKFRKRPLFEMRLVPACSILISIAGGFWLVERILGGE